MRRNDARVAEDCRQQQHGIDQKHRARESLETVDIRHGQHGEKRPAEDAANHREQIHEAEGLPRAVVEA